MDLRGNLTHVPEFDHQKPLTVGGDIVRSKSFPSITAALEQNFRRAEGEGRLGLDRNNHHGFVTEIEELPPVGGPHRLGSTRRRDLPPLPKLGKSFHVNLRLARFIGGISNPLAVG